MYDALGPQRLYWGSDLTRMPCSYSQCVRLFTDELRWLSGKRSGMDRQARDFGEKLGWPLAGRR
jgi:hypothetical protein